MQKPLNKLGGFLFGLLFVFAEENLAL